MNEGGYYPIGGAVIAEHAAQKIEACGGSCLVSHGVQSIIVENNRAVGVRAEYKGQASISVPRSLFQMPVHSPRFVNWCR